MFEHPEQQFLYNEALKTLARDPHGLLLEIGSFKGGSAKCFATAVQNATFSTTKVICIDPFYGHYDDGLKAVLAKDDCPWSSFPAFCETLGPLLKHVIPIAQTSEVACKFLSDLASHRHVSLALVDGRHEEEEVFHDLLRIHRLMPEGGHILCHDAEWIDVKNAVDRFCRFNGLEQELVCGGSFTKISLRPYSRADSSATEQSAPIG